MSLAELIKLSKTVSANPNINKLILVRSCENMGALSGCLNGWLDTKLTEYGINVFNFQLKIRTYYKPK